MNEESIQIGLLMETAQTHQKLAEASLQKLKTHLQGLDTVVRDEIRRTLVAEMPALTSAAQRATEALHAAKRAANLRVTLWSVGIITASSAIPLAIAQCVLPSQAQLAVLRAKHDELASGIARLEKLGARVELRQCGDAKRLCVRVDRKAPAYGEKADYLIVQGY